MREIKFRAKTCKDEWVDGYYVKAQKLNNKGDEHYIIEYESTGATYLIDKNTVCQYTGLKDKNGKEIYEGDIVKFDEYEYEKLAQSIISEIKWCEELCALSLVVSQRYGTRGTLSHLLDWNKEVEVIGNIFDNPELLDADKQASKYADNDVMKPAT